MDMIGSRNIALQHNPLIKKISVNPLIKTLFFGFLLLATIWGSNLPGPVLFGFSFFPIRIIVILWIPLFFLSRFKKKIHFDKVDISVIVFFAFGLLASIWSPDNTNFLTDSSVYITQLLCFFMIKSLIRSKEDIRCFLYAILVNFVIICFASIYESFTGNYISTKIYDYYLIKKNFFGLFMPSGGLGNINNLATALLCIMPFAMFATEFLKPGFVLRIGIFSLGSFVILLTGSRTGFICIILEAFLYLLYKTLTKRKEFKIFFALSIPIVVFLVFVFSKNLAEYMFSDTSIQDELRWGIWNDTFNTCKQYLFMGCGIGSSNEANILVNGFAATNPHNHFLEMLCEFGIFGLIAHLYMFLSMIPKRGQWLVFTNPVNLIFVIAFIAVSICPSSMIGIYIIWALFAFCISSKTTINHYLIAGDVKCLVLK